MPERNRRLVIALRSWMGRNPAYRNKDVLAHRLAFNPHTVQTWLLGRYYPDAAGQAAITDLTGIRFGKDGPEEPAEPTAQNQATTSHARQVRQVLKRLLRDLEPFIHGPPEGRVLLHREVGRADAGHLTAVLAALYSEEETFQAWKFMSLDIPEAA